MAGRQVSPEVGHAPASGRRYRAGTLFAGPGLVKMSDRARRLATALAGAILVAGCRSLPGSGTTLQAQEVAGLGFTHRLLVAGEVRGDAQEEEE